MAAMDVAVRIRAIDDFSATLSRLERRLKDIERAGRSGLPGGGPGLRVPGSVTPSPNGRPSIAPGVVPGSRPDGSDLAPGQGGRDGRSSRGGGIAGVGIPGSLLGAGIGGYGASSILSAAADFESALTEIQKKAGTSAEETERLGQAAMDLATSGEVAMSTAEIMSAFERGAAAGLPTEELAEFAKLSAMAADAFGMTAEEVGNAAAGFKTSFKIDQTGVRELFDLVNSLADSGIADERDIVNFLDRAGASLELFGMSKEQAAALGATMLNLKMPADVAARAMSTLTTKLLAPGSEKANIAFEKIVGNVDQFQNLLKTDANAAMDQFLQSVAALDKFEAADYLTSFLGQGFSDEVIRLAAGHAELARNMGIAANRTGWLDSLGKSYELKLNDFWSQWQVFKNRFGELTIDVGTAGLPQATAALNAIGTLIEEVQTGFQAFDDAADWSSLLNARDALAEMGTELSGLMGIDAEMSTIPKFFEDIANFANATAAAITTIDAGLDKLQSLWDGSSEEAPAEQHTIAQGGGQAVTVKEGSIVDWIMTQMGFDPADHAIDLGAAAAAKAAERGRMGESQIAGGKSGRFGVTPVPASREPAADQATIDAYFDRRRMEVGAPLIASPPVMAAPDIAAPALANAPVPTARPELDDTQYLADITAAEQALMGLASPVTGRADLDISPLLAKVATAKSAIGELNMMSGSISSGGGDASRFNARLRERF